MANLGAALNALYEARGDVGDLERAIVMIEAAIAATPEDSSDRAGHLNNFGNALAAMLERTGEIADLDGAIDRYRQAVGAAQAPLASGW